LAKLGQVRAGRGRKPVVSPEKIEEIVHLTQHEKPSGATHWSCRSMAKAIGVSPATVQRIWSGRGLQPQLVKTFKLSNDPTLQERLIGVVGLLEPTGEGGGVVHGRADLKPGVGHPGVGPHPGLVAYEEGRAPATTSFYKRTGTTTFVRRPERPGWHRDRFAVDNHRHEESLKFIRTTDTEVPKGLAVHMILDTYATHKHPDVLAWIG
jgi:hypothetical protein